MFPRDPLPDSIGPYRIVRRLASRRGADLYLGQHDGPMGFQRDCVLKLVPSPGASGDPGLAEELAHEARICSTLNHPAVVRMFDFFEHGDNLVLVFEHFAGVSLARLLSHFRRRRQRVPDAAVWYLSHRLFGALAHAHALVDEKGRRTPVIHRDVQPAHLIVSHDAHVRLAGFGIAKIAGTAGTTAIGFVKGTPAYMAPEQAAGERITERVDVYAAGLVVWEMLSGRSVRPPGDVGHGAELLKLIAGRRFDPIASLRRDIPREVAAAIDACLVPSANKRTIRCREVERWLEKVVDVEAGKKELRERLVQLRNANVRAAPAPRASSAPRGSQPPQPAQAQQPRALPSRFPGLATRVTGRPSEREEGETPRSSRRAPSLRASSYPAPAMAPEDEAAEQPGKAPKKTLLGLAPAPTPSLMKEPVRSAAPSYDAMPPPPMDEEVSSFVSTLKRPPGVELAAERASHRVAGPGRAAERVEPAAKPQAPVTMEAVEPPTGDTTVITRRGFDATQRGTWMLAGAVGLVAFVGLGVGGWFLARAITSRGDVARPAASVVSVPGASGSAAARAEPVAVASAPPVVPTVPVASAAPRGSVQPVATATTTTDPGARWVPMPENMPRYLGALLVKAPPEGTVYVSGVPLGETGEWIQIGCNRHHFVRVGTKPGPQGLRGTSWLAPGQSVMIRCGTGTEVSGTPRYMVP
jgi:serine/threonine protein kinase